MPRAVFFLTMMYRHRAMNRDLEKPEDWGPHGTRFPAGTWDLGPAAMQAVMDPQLVIRSWLICHLPWPLCGRAIPGSKWHG